MNRSGPGSNTGILLPTYNESENIEKLIVSIRKIISHCTILVVDDDSPDKTWEIVKRLSENDSGIKLLRRFNKKGRGSAGIAGFKELLRDDDIENIVEMDADFSHSPEFIPALLNGLNSCDLAIGSRYIKGGSDIERGYIRKKISILANIYSRFVLGINILDTTSGFRAFKRKTLEIIDLDTLSSKGPSIVAEILFKSDRKNLVIREIPIIFREREKGKSELSLRILLTGLVYIMKLRFLK